MSAAIFSVMLGKRPPIPPERRARYAEELAALCGIRSPELRRALATVPREAFLPPGPWTIEAIDGTHFRAEDDNPEHVLHGVGIILRRDGLQSLISANPALVCKSMENAQIGPGDRVLHVGAGLGYFSAIMAELVGPSGHVGAAEIDPQLASAARLNLAAWRNVELVGDALAQNGGEWDVVFACAGMATIPTGWIDALRPGGRMRLPLTGTNDTGFTFIIRRDGGTRRLLARLESFVRFYPCAGLRQESDMSALDKALAGGRAPYVTELRRDPHDEGVNCWLHGDGWCLSFERC